MSELCKRVRYSKVQQGYLVFVIVDIGPGDNAQFWCQESGEVRWYPFIPNLEERARALDLSRKPLPEKGWPLLEIDE